MEVESASATAKEFIKVKVKLLSTILPSISLAFSLSMLLHTLFARLIIDSSLLRIREYLVGICNFLKLLFCLVGVISVFVWVILDGKLLECFFDLVVGSISLNSHDLVVVVCRIHWIFRLLVLLSLSTTSLASSTEPSEVLAAASKVKFEILGSNSRNGNAFKVN